MKTILIYDHFIAKGGAERVSFQIAESLPECQIETAYADKTLFSQQLKSKRLFSANFNFYQKTFSTFALAWFYLMRYKLSKSSVNVVLTGVFAPLALFRQNKTNALVYFHTFPSFVNLSFQTLKQQHGLAGALVFKLFIPFYLYSLKTSVNKAQKVFSNSKSVQQRFHHIGIESQVLYPPVDLSGLAPIEIGGYFLSTSRLEHNKRVALTLAAFAQLPHINLHIVGGGQLFTELKQQYHHCANIQFLGWLNEKEVKAQYNHCKALVCIPKHEYFGLSPVEAMAAGKYVLGVAEGGLLETLTDKKLGVLLKAPITQEVLMESIVKINHNENLADDVAFRQQHAQKFAESHFISTLTKQLK